MSDSIISVENLGKKYRISHQGEKQRYTALRDVIAEKARSFFRSQKSEIRSPTSDLRPLASGTEDFWALRGVNFEVKQGEVVGIIGRNGAGKSTLLKILSRITEPTEGRVRIKGRVASLLEVGTGFHPELTGRENIFLNGAILGMHRAEIKQKFDEIVAFAEVEKFLDTPVKRYSSGMYVRLAFAVAAHLEPEILIVDEVLAVGDAEFQKKCLGKMKSVATGEGRTVLFVSHNMAAIQSLCTRVAYLQRGSLVGIGDVDSQISCYSREIVVAPHHADARRKLSPKLQIEELNFSPNPVRAGQPLNFSIELSATSSVALKDLAVLFYSGLGTRVAILDLRGAWLNSSLNGACRFQFTGCIERFNLVEGDYSVGVYINGGDVKGDFYDLSIISVIYQPRVSTVTPYAPHDRGLVEFDFQNLAEVYEQGNSRDETGD